MMSEKFEISVRSKPAFHYGQKLYFITRPRQRGFSSICPICDGTGKVSIKGKDFECPACSSGSRYSKSEHLNCIEIVDYAIDYTIINKISIEGPYTKSAFSGKVLNDNNLPEIILLIKG